MALYIGNQRVAPFISDITTWWGGKNAELICEISAERTVAQASNWSTIKDSISTSATNLTYTSNLTEDAVANPILLTWGSGNGGSNATDKLDFTSNDYFLLVDSFVDIKYTETEATMTIGHGLKHMITTLYLLYIQPKASSIDSFQYINNTFSNSALTKNLYVYRSASKAITTYTTSYGVYTTPAAPTFDSTSGTVANSINLLLPTVGVRYQNTRHALAAYDTLDANNTKIYARERLYKADKMGPRLISRLGYMYENNAFPVEAI